MYLFDKYNASHAKSDIIIWIKDKFGFKICGKCVHKQRLFREGWFFFFNWTFNNALVPRRVNIHLEFWHLVYTNSCSDGRTGISNGSMIPKLVDFWVCFYCEFDPIFFLLIQSWLRTFWFTSFRSRPLPVVTFRLFARCLRWRVHHNPQVWCCKVFWFNVSNNERTM